MKPIRNRPVQGNTEAAFTLMEVLLATMVFATILAALNAVFFGALRLHGRAMESIESRFPREYAAHIIVQDLAGAIGASGRMATNFVGKMEGNGRFRLGRLSFHTTSASSDANTRAGDIQKVEYYLAEGMLDSLLTREIIESRPRSAGFFLIRAVTRDLLSAVVAEPEEEFLLDQVESFELYFYNGDDRIWEEEWDSELLNDGQIPDAVKFILRFVDSGDSTDAINHSLEWTIPIQTQKIFDHTTLETAAVDTTAQGQENNQGGQSNSTNSNGNGNTNSNNSGNQPGGGNNTGGGR